jgi:hypothetical protein
MSAPRVLRLTNADIDNLARVAAAECYSVQGEYGMRAAVSAVLNRWSNGRFGASVHDVLTQPREKGGYQFNPISRGLENLTIPEGTRDWVKNYIRSGQDITNGATFFHASYVQGKNRFVHPPHHTLTVLGLNGDNHLFSRAYKNTVYDVPPYAVTLPGENTPIHFPGTSQPVGTTQTVDGKLLTPETFAAMTAQILDEKASRKLSPEQIQFWQRTANAFKPDENEKLTHLAAGKPLKVDGRINPDTRNAANEAGAILQERAVFARMNPPASPPTAPGPQMVDANTAQGRPRSLADLPRPTPAPTLPTATAVATVAAEIRQGVSVASLVGAPDKVKTLAAIQNHAKLAELMENGRFSKFVRMARGDRRFEGMPSKAEFKEFQEQLAAAGVVDPKGGAVIKDDGIPGPQMKRVANILMRETEVVQMAKTQSKDGLWGKDMAKLIKTTDATPTPTPGPRADATPVIRRKKPGEEGANAAPTPMSA